MPPEIAYFGRQFLAGARSGGWVWYFLQKSKIGILSWCEDRAAFGVPDGLGLSVGDGLGFRVRDGLGLGVGDELG
jgi:hypothetical protein